MSAAVISAKASSLHDDERPIDGRKQLKQDFVRHTVYGRKQTSLAGPANNGTGSNFRFASLATASSSPPHSRTMPSQRREIFDAPDFEPSVMHARFEDGTRRRNACAFPVQRSRQAPNAPSIVCIAPVTKPASGPASHATIAATSSGRPWRLTAMNPCNRSFIGPSAGFASVSIGPG
jgi:hypothetical protein